LLILFLVKFRYQGTWLFVGLVPVKMFFEEENSVAGAMHGA